MYDFYSESRKLESIFRASEVEPQCRDTNHERPRISELVQNFTDAVKALDPGEGADATFGRHSRISTAAVAILRTELAFYAVKRIQLFKWAQFPLSAVSDDNMEGMLIGVAPGDCIEAIYVLKALTTIAVGIEHTRIPLLKQMVDADIHSALSVVATELKSVLLQLHHPAALQAYDTFLNSYIIEIACSVYKAVCDCTTSDMSASSRQLLSRFWVGSVQHKTPIALMDLVSARQLPDIMDTAVQFGVIIAAHVSALEVGNDRLPEWLKALEALCRSHAVQRFGVQMLQRMLSSDHYSADIIIFCIMWIKYLIHVFKGGYEETQVLSDSLISSEGGVLVEPLKQFAAGKLGSDWGWSIDLTGFVVNLFLSALEQCSSARAGCHLEVLVSVARQAGALLALRRLPLEQQKRSVRQARAAGILQGMMQLEPTIAANASIINDSLRFLCFRGLSVLLPPPSASGHRIEMSPMNMSVGELTAACEACLRSAQESCHAGTLEVIFGMIGYLSDTVGQLQRPSDCALGFLTSLRKVMGPYLVEEGDSNNMTAVKCSVLLIASRNSFADTSPAPGPGVLSAILLQFLPLFKRCTLDSNCSWSPIITWSLIQSAVDEDPDASCEIAAAYNAAELRAWQPQLLAGQSYMVLKMMMRHDRPLDLQRLLTDSHICIDGGLVETVYPRFTRHDSNKFNLGIQKAWDYQVLMVADPLTRLLEQVPGELRPRALLVAVCGVESLTRGTASLELPSKIALRDEAAELMTCLSLCGNDTADVYPRVQALVGRLMAEARALQPVVPPSLESLRIKAPIPGCYNPRCINLSGVSESLMECKRCSGCKKAQFCSVACQRQHWPAHRKACREAASQ